jgi:glycosyltransferase involved in cell wall biosynthesis
MKVLLISRGYPSKRSPGWGIFERDQALALQALGHEVIIMSVELRYYWRSIGLFHYSDNGLEIFSIGFPNFFSQLPERWAFGVRRKLALLLFKKIVKQYGKPDILYAQYFYNITIAAEIKKKYGVPLVGIEHWSKLTQKKISNYMLVAGNEAYNTTDQIITVSESLRKQLLLHFNKDSLIVNNMVGDEFTRSEVLNKVKDNAFPTNYVTVGNLIQRKGFDILIDAFHISGLKEKGVTITIVGGGPELGALQKQITDYGLLNNIILVGRKSRKEIIEILNNSDVFVLSSRAETFSVVCIEALCLGLPVIATICGGPEEFINEKNGLLVPTNDAKALSTAIQTMYNTFSNYKRKLIAEESRQRFSSSEIAKKLIKIFEDVIKSKILRLN